jgi:hypothetical protein
MSWLAMCEPPLAEKRFEVGDKAPNVCLVCMTYYDQGNKSLCYLVYSLVPCMNALSIVNVLLFGIIRNKPVSLVAFY